MGSALALAGVLVGAAAAAGCGSHAGFCEDTCGGWRYVAAMLEGQGAAKLGDKDVGRWLAEWLPRLTRPLHHDGNLRYAWGLTETVKAHLGDGQPYPKLVLPDLVPAEGGTLVLRALADRVAA
jgi:hypothetical protein